MRKRATLLGAQLSRNRGAASMVSVVARTLHNLGFKVHVISKYPSEDAKFAEILRVSHTSLSQFQTTFFLFLSLFFIWLPPIRTAIRKRFFGSADLFVDISGIAFSDERGFTGFLINATNALIPIVLHRPVYRLSQAYGPMNSWFNRQVAPLLLRRASCIYSRGEISNEILKNNNVQSSFASDLAFLLGDSIRPQPLQDKTVVICPSAVIDQKLKNRYGESFYLSTLSIICRRLIALGFQINIISYADSDLTTTRNNDRPIVHALARNLSSDKVNIIYPSIDPMKANTCFYGAKLVITGRFHAMIGALSLGIPVIVTAWSHKYEEVLRQFQLTDFSFSIDDLDVEYLWRGIEYALANADDVRKKIETHLGSVKNNAWKNFESFADIA